MSDMRKEGYTTALWDMDGTLFNTRSGIVRGLNETMDEMGRPRFTDEQMDTMIGPPMQISFARLLGVDAETAGRFAEVFREKYAGNGYVFDCQLYDGIIEAMEQLRSMGVRNCIATLKRDVTARMIVQKFGLERYVDSMHGSDEKDELTKADIIRMCCRDAGEEDVGRAVMIGDTIYDAEGAKKAGCAFLAVSYGFGFRTVRDLEGYENIGIASSPGEIAGFFRT